MKLKISLVSLLLTFVAVTFAQEAKTYTETAGFKNAFNHNGAGSNWFIQLGAGVQMLGAEGFEKAVFDSKQLTLAPTFAIGKWFSPWLGLRLKAEGGSLHSFPIVDLAGDTDYSFTQKDRYYAGHFDLMWNMSNYYGKYNAKRVFSFIPYVGLGGYYREESDQIIPNYTNRNGEIGGISLHGGLLFHFRLANRVGFHLDLAGMMVDDRFNRIVGNPLIDRALGRYEGVASATAGFTFNLGKTYFEVAEAVDYGLINDLNSKINDLRAENDLLSKRPVSCPKCPDPAPVVAVADNNFVSNVVVFRISSSTVDANQQAGIYNTAQFVKNSGEKIKVVGYADKQTGSSAYNLKLSERRAKAVAKELTSRYGIPSDKIVVEWKGANEQPYGENSWNRVVIMSAQ